LFHTAPGRWTPRQPCVLRTSLPRDNHPFASRAECPECKPPRPAGCAGGAAYARSRWMTRGSTRSLRARHGPPALVPLVLPDPPYPSDSARPERTAIPDVLAEMRRVGEQRRPRIHRARRPRTGHGQFGRRSGVRCKVGGRVHHPVRVVRIYRLRRTDQSSAGRGNRKGAASGCHRATVLVVRGRLGHPPQGGWTGPEASGRDSQGGKG